MQFPVPFHQPLRLAGAALVYFLLGLLALRQFSLDGVVSFFWPASGWALAILLLGGQRYAWSILLGSVAAHLAVGTSLWSAAGVGIAATASALLSYRLLTRKSSFDADMSTIAAYRDLVLLGTFPGAVLGTVLGISSLVLGGDLDRAAMGLSLGYWACGEIIGVTTITPLLLTWRKGLVEFNSPLSWLELAVVTALTVTMGQMVYLGWWPDILSDFPRKIFWVVAPVLWAAVRLGPQATSLLLCLLVIQISLSIPMNVGFLSPAPPYVRTIDGSASIFIFGSMIMTLAAYIRQLKHAEAEMRIAATAFECQEGMIITDADMRILRVNQSFTRIMGYTQEEVLGRKTTFMRSDRHPPSFYEHAWRTAGEQGSWYDEVWNRRKNGEIFPQQLTTTAVKDANGTITNFVITHTDISYRKQKEAELLASQLEQRDALVREVHHRIKNNLQGITGLLRQFARAHPDTAGPINQAISQVRSIAVIHGLQGRSSERMVRLCELTAAIAGDIAALWQVPVRVDIPEPWTPCIVSEAESVPLALVLNELIINAVKHGSEHARGVDIRLRKGEHKDDHIHIRISNPGVWQPLPAGSKGGPIRNGLQLVEAMLPPSGTRILREQEDGMIHVWLTLEPPVITLEIAKKTNAPLSVTPTPPAAAG